jgi:hypothetical protein
LAQYATRSTTSRRIDHALHVDRRAARHEGYGTAATTKPVRDSISAVASKQQRIDPWLRRPTIARTAHDSHGSARAARRGETGATTAHAVGRRATRRDNAAARGTGIRLERAFDAKVGRRDQCECAKPLNAHDDACFDRDAPVTDDADLRTSHLRNDRYVAVDVRVDGRVLGENEILGRSIVIACRRDVPRHDPCSSTRHR